jgi:hypothetical protein
MGRLVLLGRLDDALELLPLVQTKGVQCWLELPM